MPGAATDTVLLGVFGVLFVGLYAYIRIAQRDARLLTRRGAEGAPAAPWRLKSFFLAGGTLGGDLTENNTLGMTFAWAGGIWYFATISYAFGPNVLWSQIPWCISVIALGLLLPRIIVRIRSRTIHGFLAGHFGPRTQKVAAVATTLGYFFNAGFEICWAALLFAGALGQPGLKLPVALGMALFVGAYCMIGGYRSNATVDRPHNILGVLGLAALVALVASSVSTGGGLRNAVMIFVGGAILYALVSTATGLRLIRARRWMLNTLAVAYAVGAFLVVHLVMGSPLGHGPVADPHIQGAPMPLYIYVATISFQLFFNVIDMQTWQQVAANEDIQPPEPKTYRSLGQSIIRASLYLLWFPALGGVLLGCVMRSVQGVGPNDLFSVAFGLVQIDGGDVVRGVVLGGILLALLSTSMSTIDSLLMSALQTMTYDLFRWRKIDEILAAPDRDNPLVVAEEIKLTQRSRSFLIPISVLMALIFYALLVVFPQDKVLLFQPMMYAMPLGLFAPALLALFWPQIAAQPGMGAWVFGGILSAIVAAIGLVLASVAPFATPDEQTWLPSIMPIVTNLLSIGAVVVGARVTRPSRREVTA